MLRLPNESKRSSRIGARLAVENSDKFQGRLSPTVAPGCERPCPFCWASWRLLGAMIRTDCEQGHGFF